MCCSLPSNTMNIILSDMLLNGFSLYNSWRRKCLQPFIHSSCPFPCGEWKLFPKKNVILKLPLGKGFTLSVHLVFIISVSTCQALSFTVLRWKKRNKINSLIEFA